MLPAECSGDEFFDDFSVDVGEAEIASGVAEGELFVVEADEFQQGGVQIVYVHGFFDSFETEFVGGPMCITSADTTACEPHCEAPVVVIASVDFSGVGAFGGEFDSGCSAEFTAPDDQCFVEQSALSEVCEEGCDGLIALAGQSGVIDFDIVVVVPRLSLAVPDLDEAYAAFHQPAGDQDLPRLDSFTIHFANVFWFA